MSLEWDPDKALDNERKHGVGFSEVAVVLHDENAITIDDLEESETRFVTIGMDATARLLPESSITSWRLVKEAVIVFEKRFDSWEKLSKGDRAAAIA